MKKLGTVSAMLVGIASAIGLLTVVGCGGGSSASTSTSTTSGSATSSLLVTIGDDPSSRVMGLATTISSMTLTGSHGSVNVMPSATPVEMAHLLGSTQPLTMMKVPQDTYTSATINMGQSTVTYMNPSTGKIMQQTVPASSMTVAMNPPMTVGSGAMVLNADMNLASSVHIDNSGNVTMTPTFTMSAMAPGSGGSQNGMVHMSGSVGSASSNSFSMSSMQTSQSMNISTNSSTGFQGMGGMGMMSGGQIVSVDAMMQSDGTMLAQNVQMMQNSGGSMAMGVVNSVTGSPATQFTIVMQDGAGNGMTSSDLSNGLTVNVDSSTTYTITSYGADLSGLPFTPTFDGKTIAKGQEVEPVSSGGMMNGGGMMGGGGTTTGTVTATAVYLIQQGFTGTVSNYSGSSSQGTFTLTLPSDSAFATLTGATTIIAYQQSGTTLSGLTSVGNGTSVQVRGLLFFDSGTYKMVLTRIVAAS